MLLAYELGMLLAYGLVGVLTYESSGTVDLRVRSWQIALDLGVSALMIVCMDRYRVFTHIGDRGCLEKSEVPYVFA